MTIEERNKWLVEHQVWFAEKVKNFCDKHPEMDFGELYSDSAMKLIEYLDEWKETYDPSYTYLIKKLNPYFWKLLERSKKEKKEIPSGLEFEMIYEPDFNKNIWPYLIDKVGTMTDKEKEVIKRRIFEDCLFEDIANEYRLSRNRISQIYEKACMKVYVRMFSKKCYRYLWEFNELAAIDDEEIRVIGKVLTDHNDKMEAVDEIRKQLASFYKVPKEDIIFRSFDGIEMIRIVEKFECDL